MSFFQRAFSFLNCTHCGKFFNYNEKVLSCENRHNRDCFDHEAVCGKCMHDHAESIHVMDKQRYIIEFVARRHDIEENIRDFINKTETKFFDGSIDRVVAGPKPANFAEVVERRKAELLQLRSYFNEVTSSLERKVAQPESPSGTSTISTAVESVPEKEVVANLSGIDLITWAEWSTIQKRQQEDMVRLWQKLTKSQPGKSQETKFPGIDLKDGEEIALPFIKNHQEEEAKQQQIQEYKSSRLQPDKMAQSFPPGDITTQPNAKLIFNAPFDDRHTHHIKIINSGVRRIGWTSKTTNMKRLRVDPSCGVLDPKETLLVAVSTNAFVFDQVDTKNDRLTIEWTNTPDGAAKQFRREWFGGDGLARRRCLPIEYNP